MEKKDPKYQISKGEKINSKSPELYDDFQAGRYHEDKRT
jgi:hypothetical protein